MTRKQVKQLAIASYKNDNLDEKKVLTISKLLSRSYLKLYLKYLKALEKSKTVLVLIANKTQKIELAKEIKKMYPNKKIEFKEDKSIIAGVRIIDNDNIYDFNINNTLNNLVSYINQ